MFVLTSALCWGPVRVAGGGVVVAVSVVVQFYFGILLLPGDAEFGVGAEPANSPDEETPMRGILTKA